MSYDPLPLMRAKSFLIETPTSIYQDEFVYDRDSFNNTKRKLRLLIRSATANEFVGHHHAYRSPHLWVLVTQLDAASHKIDAIWFGKAFFPVDGSSAKVVSDAEIATIVRDCENRPWQFP